MLYCVVLCCVVMGDKGSKERNWPPYLTMPTIQDKGPLQCALLNVRNRIIGLTSTFHFHQILLHCVALYCHAFEPKWKVIIGT